MTAGKVVDVARLRELRKKAIDSVDMGPPAYSEEKWEEFVQAMSDAAPALLDAYEERERYRAALELIESRSECSWTRLHARAALAKDGAE